MAHFFYRGEFYLSYLTPPTSKRWKFFMLLKIKQLKARFLINYECGVAFLLKQNSLYGNIVTMIQILLDRLLGLRRISLRPHPMERSRVAAATTTMIQILLDAMKKFIKIQPPFTYYISLIFFLFSLKN